MAILKPMGKLHLETKWQLTEELPVSALSSVCGDLESNEERWDLKLFESTGCVCRVFEAPGAGPCWRLLFDEGLLSWAFLPSLLAYSALPYLL